MRKGIVCLLAAVVFVLTGVAEDWTVKGFLPGISVEVESATAQVNPAPSVPQDPCVYGTKKSVAIAISSATTTQLVAGVANTSIYICGYQDSFTEGTAGTMQLEYGTGSTCSGGLTALTGVYSNAAAVTVQDNVTYGPFGSTVAFVPYNTTGNSLCALSTGTDVQAGIVTYVQQ